jgi:hypothetical protein
MGGNRLKAEADYRSLNFGGIEFFLDYQMKYLKNTRTKDV